MVKSMVPALKVGPVMVPEQVERVEEAEEEGDLRLGTCSPQLQPRRSWEGREVKTRFSL